MSQKQHLRITYDGQALQAHTMDVRTLAPALLAFGDLAEEAGKLLFGENIKINTEVKASFKSGSFGIDLSIVTDLLQQFTDLFSTKEASATANALAILTALGVIGKKGLIPLIKKMRGRSIKKITPIAEKHQVLIELEDSETIEVEEQVIRLLRSHSVRINLERVIHPIEQTGIDSIAFGTDTEINVMVTQQEAQYFHAPDPSERIVQDDIRIIPFSIVTVSFKEGNKWRLYDGQNTVNVSIEDQDFLNKVNHSFIRFAKGDIIEAETRILSIQNKDGLKTEYTILKVIKHIPALDQINLPIE